MNTNIPITVRERVPTVPEEYSVISHNTDYTVTFDFDSDWTTKYKTVYFVGESGEYTPVVMEGNTCDVPEVKGDCRYLFIGVQEGTAKKPGVLKTSRACCLKIRDSITDMIDAPIADPAPSVYEQIMALLEKLTTPTWSDVKDKPFSALGDGLSVDEAGVLSAQGGSGGTPNAVQYVAQSLTDEQKAQARTNIGAGTSSFSGSYNDLADKPTIPEGYTLPVASSDMLGGVKPAAKTDAMTSAVGVDADGKLWSAAGGGEWELINSVTIPEDAEETNAFIFTTDKNGNSFALKTASLGYRYPAYTGESTIPSYCFAKLNNGYGMIYTGLRMPDKAKASGGVWTVDFSHGQQIEETVNSNVYTPNDSEYTDSNPTFRKRYSMAREGTISSIGVQYALIFPGCKFELYGVRA